MSAVFYPLFRDDLSFILLVTLLVFPLIMLITLIISTASLKIKLSGFSETTVRGEKIAMRVNIQNRCFLPIASLALNLYYRADGEKSYKKYSLTIPVKAHSTENVVVNITPKHCGTVECYIKKAVVSDLIGLLSLPKKLGYRCRIAVMPVETECSAAVENSFDSISDSMTFSSCRSGDDPSEVFGLRDYRNGDRMNRIHWKLSSRSSDFIVKELSMPISSKLLIVPDISACRNRDEVDLVMDVFASLARFLVCENIGCTILDRDSELNFLPAAADNELNGIIIQQVYNLSEYTNNLSLTAELSALYAESDEGGHFSHTIIITPTERKAALCQLEQGGISENITVLCTGEKGSIEEDKHSDVIILYINEGGSVRIPENFTI